MQMCVQGRNVHRGTETIDLGFLAARPSVLVLGPSANPFPVLPWLQSSGLPQALMGPIMNVTSCVCSAFLRPSFIQWESIVPGEQGGKEIFYFTDLGLPLIFRAIFNDNGLISLCLLVTAESTCRTSASSWGLLAVSQHGKEVERAPVACRMNWCTNKKARDQEGTRLHYLFITVCSHKTTSMHSWRWSPLWPNYLPQASSP